ncbi:hypothetical protein BDV59DRAFT_188198 [Aspergillus ambiguus]|uniref:uncharacterized protein n=1 Tax=Aspergillus ambiguus TaxID=176160 RepID=UPI003CCE34AC
MASNPMKLGPWFGPAEAAEYFRSLVLEVSEKQAHETNTILLNHVHNGAISPKIFAIWLFRAHPQFPSILRCALLDESSAGVRHAGINALKCAMKRDHWREKGWDAVGGTTGLKEIFERLSVQELNYLARAIGSCSSVRDASRSQAVDELLELLIPNFFELRSGPGSPRSSRQLLRVDDLIPMFRMASHTVLIKLFSKDNFHVPNGLLSLLLESHMALLRAVAVGSIPADRQLRRRLLDGHLSKLLESPEPYESKNFAGSRTNPAALGFTVDLITNSRGSSAENFKVLRSTLNSCIETAIKQSRRRKVPFDVILTFLERVLPNVSDSEDTFYKWRPVLSPLVQLWSIAACPKASIESSSRVRSQRHRYETDPARPREAHKERLETLLRNILKTMTKQDLSICLARLVSPVVAEAKLPLLKIITKNLRGTEIDLEQPVPSDNEEQLLPWSASFLMSLPAQDARWLFERAAQLTPTESLITNIETEWLPTGEDRTSFNERLFQVHLESTNNQTHRKDSVTRTFIGDLRLKAEKARDTADRLQWAKLAVEVALIGKNLLILKDAIEWTNRFLRDPFVRPSLAKRLYEADVAAVLSCASPSNLSRFLSLKDLMADIGVADAVIFDLLKTALLAQQEPWYKDNQDLGIRVLLRRVVSHRIDSVKTLCHRHLGNEKEIVEVLFDKLVPVLLEYDRVGITEGYESLGWGGLCGPLHGLPSPRNPSHEILRVLDLLAQQRDHLFAKQRLIWNPHTASFPQGLPRGLPVQYLFPSTEWTIAVANTKEIGNFIARRVREVVFCDAGTSLQKIDQEDCRIGPFVDDLKFAIRIYVGHGTAEEQSANILEIWHHYSEKIPSAAGHLESFKEYLYSFAQERGLHKTARAIDPPQLPSVDIFRNMSHSSLSLEWDPRTQSPQSPPPSNWEESLLQHRFFALQHNGTLEATIQAYSRPCPWRSTAKSNAFHIWRPNGGTRRLSYQHKEALIASALLFLNSLTRNAGRLLSGPFPEETSVLRYPPVHLDYDFLSSIDDQKEAANAAISALGGLMDMVPPNLLHELSLSLMETLSELESTSPKYSIIQRCAFETMGLLRCSDTPELAANLGLKALELFPNASSWHRKAFPSSLAASVSRDAAERIMQEFTTYIFGKLRKRTKPKSAEPLSEEDGKEDKVGIKLTTVKMLGTMLAENKFGVSPSFAVGALKQLFNACNHIDVRVTVCNGLLSIVGEYDDADEAYEVLTSFASFASAPSETSGSGPWLESEQAELPDVDSQRPLLHLFVKTARGKLPAKYREQYVNKTLLPLVEESTRQHNIWMRRFLSRIELTPDELSVTNFGPFSTSLIQTMLETWLEFLPREYLLRHRSWALAYLDCFKLQNINDKLTAQDRSWRSSNAGRHWVSYFDSHKNNSVSVQTLLWKLGCGMKSEVDGGISDEIIADEIAKRAAIVVRNPFRHSGYYFEVSLRPITDILSRLQNAEQPGTKQGAKVLHLAERVLADIDSLRTEEWSNDPHRNPPVLPTRFQLQTLLLPYPNLNKASPSRHKEFISRVVALMEGIANSPACIAETNILRDVMYRVERQDAHQCALELGQGYNSSENALAQYVRVWAAQILLQRRVKPKSKDDTEVEEMVSGWKRSPNEWVRSVGWSTRPQVR